MVQILSDSSTLYSVIVVSKFGVLEVSNLKLNSILDVLNSFSQVTDKYVPNEM